MSQNLIIQSHIDELESMGNFDHKALKKELLNNQTKIKLNENIYYDKLLDNLHIQKYYRNLIFDGLTPAQLFNDLHQLVKNTHQHKCPYYVSKDYYLYTWVDLHPNGELISIYSGESKKPLKVIEEDIEIIQRRYKFYQQLIYNYTFQNSEIDQEMLEILRQHKFNTEHVIPQSWFEAREPMKGDLHHLFVCETKCNNARSNFPYYDFSYGSASSSKHYRGDCGTYENGRFEPEYGKGVVARATFYFLTRYPGKVLNRFRKCIDISLLKRWNDQFPVTKYEKHRNNAIYEIQGNRNPFIDFPDLVHKIRFKGK